MPLSTIQLPYGEGELEPHISKETVRTHYFKHHMGYVEKVNKAFNGDADQKEMDSEAAIRRIQDNDRLSPALNAALQVWNHEMYWKSMSPNGGGKPSEKLQGMINLSFGSHDNFKAAFVEKAAGHFGSGWIWLVEDKDKLDILETHDADNPLVKNIRALLCCDVWEHAYYLDYKNEKKRYAENFVNRLINWDYAQSQLEP